MVRPTRSLDFVIGDRVVIDGREHRFAGCCEPETDDPGLPFDLKFDDFKSNAPLRLSQRQFDEAFCAGKIRWLKPYEKLTDTAPDEDRYDLPNARLRRLYCLAFDAAPTSRSTKALVEFVERTAPTIQIEHKPPSAGALRRWLGGRGEPGDRRLRFMGDRFARGPSKMRISATALKVLSEKADAYYDGVHVNQHNVYCAVRAEFVEINRGRREEGLSPLSAPSKSTVHRYLVQHRDYGNSLRRYGYRGGARAFDPIKGSMNPQHILEIAIIDHTPIDCSVADDEHLVCAGRPYLTMVIDAYSRNPLGFCLSFEPPSLYTAMAATLHALQPKIEVAREYPDIVGEWVAFGRPETIVADNAWEFTGSSFRDACADQGINLTFAPIANGEYKGIGERMFQTLNTMLFHRLPGGLPYTPQRRKELGIDPAHEAVLLLSDLKRLIYQCIIEVYGREYHKGIKSSPQQLWEKQAPLHGVPYVQDLEAAKASFTRLASQRTLSREGITLLGLTYRAPEALAGLLNDLVPRSPRRGVRDGTAKVKVKYSPADLGQVYVWNEVRQAYVVLHCAMPKYASGLSEYQHKLIDAFAKEQHLEFQSEDDRCIARARLSEEVRASIPASKIGDRRRAQRMKSDVATPSGGDQMLITEVDGPEHGIPMAGAANRKDGDRPYRAPITQAAARARSKQARAAPVNNKPAAVLAVVEDAFADVNFAQLQEDARQSLDEQR